MKSTYIKLPAIFALLIDILAALIFWMTVWTHVSQGIGLFWVGVSLLLIFYALYLYVVDAILSIIKIFTKINPFFNTALSLTIFSEIILSVVMYTNLYSDLPMNFLFRLWHILYLTIIILEIISIIKHVIMNSKKHVNTEETFL